MKKILHLALILLLAGSASAFNVTLENSADRENLEYDILRNFSGFYNNFPETYDQRDEIGSFSFADQSLENPDYRLDFTDGNYSFLSQRNVQLYYASQTGNTTVPLMGSPLDTGNLSEADSTVDLEISPFRSLYPGEIYMGFTQRKFQVNGSNRSNTGSDVFNLTKLGTVMEGNYSVSPSIRRLQNSTRLTVDQVKDDDDRLIYSSQKSPELVISVSKNGEVLDEARARPGRGEVLDIAFSGGEEVFVNGFKVLETRGVPECETISDNDFYYIVNQSNFNTESGENPGCLKVENTTETVVDFANTTIDGQRENDSFTEGCALTVTNSSGVEIKEPRVQQYEKGICVEDSRNTFITGTASKENSLGVVMENSSTSITKISLENNKSEIRAQNSSTVNMTEVNFDTADISLFGKILRRITFTSGLRIRMGR